MAWIKEVTDPRTGVTAEYWEVIGVTYNHRAQKSMLSIGGWFNASAYSNDLQPVFERSWEIPSGLAPELSAGAVAFVSGYAKAQPEFTGWTAP